MHKFRPGLMRCNSISKMYLHPLAPDLNLANREKMDANRLANAKMRSWMLSSFPHLAANNSFSYHFQQKVFGMLIFDFLR